MENISENSVDVFPGQKAPLTIENKERLLFLGGSKLKIFLISSCIILGTASSNEKESMTMISDGITRDMVSKDLLIMWAEDNAAIHLKMRGVDPTSVTFEVLENNGDSYKIQAIPEGKSEGPVLDVTFEEVREWSTTGKKSSFNSFELCEK